ncbi:DUF3011 domain-containing protein [Cyanothece sp. BG0011]|uniref:DUF3011 domain-containing protein n=1 Tax=Cyanothece sp. BG0011 TaxID=2082950 RepID=UPI000D1FC1C8|nr:DUF3011 domain-containing protein [Cyanothece sp. BG0011]
MIINCLNRLTIITGISLGLLLQTIPAEARQTISCESFKYRYQFCRANTRGGVRLTRQLSNTRCVEGDTWGYDRDGIWVDRGCAAEFSVRDRNPGYDNSNNSSGGSDAAAIVGGALVVGAIAAAIAGGSNNNSSDGRTITCNSDNGQYTTCPVSLGRDDWIVLDRQLSQAGCWEGDTWGYDSQKIWVDNGCRGVFEIRR